LEAQEKAEAWFNNHIRSNPNQLDSFLESNLSMPNGPRLPVVLWSRLYSDIKPYLTEREVNGTVLLSFFHREIGEKLFTILVKPTDIQKCQRAIAEYFNQQPNWQDITREALPNFRKTWELPFQLSQMEMREELATVLSDLDFMESKVAARMSLDLLNDYSRAIRGSNGVTSEKMANGLKEFDHFMKSYLYVLDPYPDLIYQQAINSPAGSAPYAAAMDLLSKGKICQPWLRRTHSELSDQPALTTFRLQSPPIWTACSYSGERIALIAGDAWIFETKSGKVLFHLIANESATWTAAAISPDGKLLATVNQINESLNRFTLWEIDTHRKVLEFQNPFSQILDLQFTPDGTGLVFCGAMDYAGIIVSVTLTDGGIQWTGTIPGVLVRHIIFTPDHRYIIVAQGDGVCSFWNMTTGKREREIQLHNGAITDLGFSPAGDLLVSCSKDGSCKVWSFSLSNSKRLQHQKILRNVRVFLNHPTAPFSATFLDKSTIVSGDTGGMIKIWNASNGKEEGNASRIHGGISALKISSNGKILLMTSTEETVCRIFEAEEFPHQYSTIFNDETIFLKFSSLTDNLIRVKRSGEVEELAVKDGWSTTSLPVRYPNLQAITSSPDGRFLLLAEEDSNWKLIDRTRSDLFGDLFENQPSSPSMISVSANGEWICLFSKEVLEVYSTIGERATKKSFSAVPNGRIALNAMDIRFLDERTLRLVGINNRIQGQAPGSTLVMDLYLDHREGGHYWGPFEDEPLNMESRFLIIGFNTFLQWINDRDNRGTIFLKNVDGHMLAKRSFPGPVDIHYISSDEKYALLTERFATMCHVIDLGSVDLKTAWRFPLNQSINCGTIQPEGKLIALGYMHGGIDILERNEGLLKRVQ
jgi:WD40 repeat protein